MRVKNRVTRDQKCVIRVRNLCDKIRKILVGKYEIKKGGMEGRKSC